VAADDAARAVAMATVAAREAALHSCATAIQTLGGTGFTWEHPVHWLYRRARWIAGFDGTPAAHRARLASLLLDGSPVESVAVRP
jgi:alkylation response protein AidB-like acyl-CoA dehydrogenase